MNRKKPYHKMTAAELADATKEFEKDTPLEEGEPLSAELKAKWGRARRARPGRPRVGRGARAVLVTIERGLLARADAFAAAQGMSRSEMIARGLHLVMAAGDDAKRPARRAAG